MADYLSFVIIASFFCTVVSALLNENGIGKTAKAVINIVMLVIVISPFLRGLCVFSDFVNVAVINSEQHHIIDSEEDDVKKYREWLANVTAKELSKEISESVRNGIGITVRVQCPWHFEAENVVFDKIRIYTSSQPRYYDSIENYVKLHFSLDSECIKEVE